MNVGIWRFNFYYTADAKLRSRTNIAIAIQKNTAGVDLDVTALSLTRISADRAIFSSSYCICVDGDVATSSSSSSVGSDYAVTAQL